MARLTVARAVSGLNNRALHRHQPQGGCSARELWREIRSTERETS